MRESVGELSKEHDHDGNIIITFPKVRLVTYSKGELADLREIIEKDLEFEYSRNPDGSHYSDKLEDKLEQIKFLMGDR